MEITFTFILGLLIGLGICAIGRYQVNRKAKHILALLPQRAEFESSLPILSRLRGAVNLLARSHRELEEQLIQLQAAIDIAPIGYLQIDRLNHLLWCNRYSRQLLKIDRWNPDRQRLLLELVRSYELDRLIERTRRKQTPQQQEWVYQSMPFSEETVPFQDYSVTLRASSVPLPEGQVGVFLENRQLLVEAISSRDRVFSDLTHELRTPLTSIYLVAEALQTRVDPSLKMWVDRIVGELDRLIALIKDALDVTQFQHSSEANLDLQPLNLKALLFSVWQTLEPLARQKSLALHYSGEESQQVLGDRDRLVQVFLNILDNSVKYSPDRTTIRVEVTAHGSAETPSNPKYWITINITDSGCGFGESDLERVFERLYRGDPSRQSLVNSSGSDLASPRRGSGLGLTIARQIVLAHGGAISAKNHPETGGAWLQIQLPEFH
ncbi:MAG: HAMP domain-containing histidine kinase [Cyanobacteria bacterium SBLK]|nr:HAMP domain-containing histidine kinase [Cyanobacteria bacterium SBLK]